MATSRPPPDPSSLVLGRIPARRGRIALTYTLTLVENLFELSYPLAIGIAINGLLQGDHVALAPLVSVWLLHILIGGARQVYDTWLFSSLYADIAADIVVLQREAGYEVSEVAARIEMASEFAGVLETDIPEMVKAFVSLVGGAALLYLYDGLAGLIMTMLLVPVIIINTVMGRRALGYNEALNNQSEQQVGVIAAGRRQRARLHFGRLAQWRIRLSTAEAASWTFAELFGLTACVLVLIRLASMPGLLAGDIFAGLAYVLRILDAIDEVPGVVQQAGRLYDIRRRIKSV